MCIFLFIYYLYKYTLTGEVYSYTMIKELSAYKIYFELMNKNFA